MRRRDLAWALALPASARAQPAPAALQAFTENLAPLNYLRDGRAQGFSVELLQLMAESLKRPLQTQVLPWARSVLLASQTPNSLLFSLTRTPEREAQFRWVGPIAERRILVYERADRSASRAGLRAEELMSQKLGVVRDSAIDRHLQARGWLPGRHLEHALDDESNLRMLLAGRMPYIAMLDWAAAWHLSERGLPYDSLRAVLELDTRHSYWYGLPPDSDGELLAALQAALDRLKREGRYQRLRAAYFR